MYQAIHSMTTIKLDQAIYVPETEEKLKGKFKQIIFKIDANGCLVKEKSRKLTAIPADAILFTPLEYSAAKKHLYRSETNPLLFPRCEFRQNYIDTSHYPMTEEQHHGTYVRSTGRGGNSSRFTQTDIAQKTFEVAAINALKKDLNRANMGNYQGHTGTFCSPFEFSSYQKAFKEAAQKARVEVRSEASFQAAELHDLILTYKNTLCEEAVHRFSADFPELEDKIAVYHHNNYPCIMVSLKVNQEAQTEQSLWYQEPFQALYAAYFIALTNKKAEELRIPIELIHRSGFGYHIPTIDTTGSCFRISMGVVPKIYIDVLVESLSQLLDIIEQVIEENFALYKKGEIKCIDTMNIRINRYRKKRLHKWERDDSIAKILTRQGDAKGQNIAYQLTRQRYYIDLLAQYVAKQQEETAPDYAVPLVDMIMHLDFGQKISSTNVVSMNIQTSDFVGLKEWPNEEHSSIKKDINFWTLIENIFDSINAKHTLNKNSVKGLYAQLEQANKEFIIRAVNRKNIKANDGVGSDSEYEKEYGDISIHGKKLTVATGMMAINVANFLARRFLKNNGIDEYRTDTRYMYYETDGIFGVERHDCRC